MGVVVAGVRPMRLENLDQVVALELAHQPQPWSEAVFRDELSQDNRVYLVAGDPIVGFGGVMLVGDEAHVTNLLVTPGHRRRGIGRRIAVSLFESAIAAGARHLTLEVRSSNKAARELYSSLGLAPVGVRPGYYRDDDALIMWAHDIHDPGFLERLG